MDLWQHQRDAFDFIASRRGVLLDMFMGTGKSRVIVEAINSWPAGRVLILCPKSVLGVWRRELDRWSNGAHHQLILDQSTGERKRDSLRNRLASSAPLVVVINYDAARSKSLRSTLLAVPWTEVICDESHRIKAHNSQISQLAAGLGARARKRIAMSGTPMANSPLDLFGQFRFLDPTILGNSWYHFAERFAIKEKIPGVARPVVKRANMRMLPELRRLTDPLTFRTPRSVLSLPPVLHQQIPVYLARKAHRAYLQLENNLEAELDEGRITAANTAVALLRLQQITGGHAATDNGSVAIDFGKFNALLDILLDADPAEPVVVFCRFLPELQAIAAAAQRTGRPYAELSGARKELTPTGELPDTPGLVLGVQIQAGGLGVDLTRARVGVYWSTSFSLGDHEQSLARIHRPGQTKPVIYKHLIAAATVDELIARCLQDKQNVIDILLRKGLRRA